MVKVDQAINPVSNIRTTQVKPNDLDQTIHLFAESVYNDNLDEVQTHLTDHATEVFDAFRSQGIAERLIDEAEQ